MRRILWIIVLISLNRLSAQVNRYDVLINELMADPSPVVGLPNAEYIELKNIGGHPVNLYKWKISNGSSSGIISINRLLEPDSLVVLCSRTQVALFDSTINVIGITGFPSLLNEAGTVILSSPDGKTIHALNYRADMHSNLVKKEGGWSLEIIDALQPCHPGNLHSSNNPKGGTPGKPNSSVAVKLPELTLSAMNCIAESNKSLLLQLNQGIDSNAAVNISNLMISPADTRILSANPLPPLFDQIRFTLQSPIQETKVYQLKSSHLKRCNSQQADSISVFTGLTSVAVEGDVLINEILFNPPPGGADFVELFNRSEKIINLKDLLLANRNEAGQLSAFYPVSTSNRNFFPGEHIVLTTDTAYLAKNWPGCINNLLLKSTLPSLPDDKGNISILNREGNEIDVLTYNESMHFRLLNNKEGVSLERISSKFPGNDESNWHSAASSSGYATPTRRNSQHRSFSSQTVKIDIQPQILSPNNDGVNDILSLTYLFKENGNLLSSHIFNMNGVWQGKIINNVLCGTSGILTWDGSINGKRLLPGNYILLIDLLTKTGMSTKVKKIIAIQ